MHPERIDIDPSVRREMLAHARAEFPLEACGLLAGPAPDRVTVFYPTANVETSSTRYTVDPVHHHAALQAAEARALDLIGVMHSHPVGVAYPSPVDVGGALDPVWMYVVVGPVEGRTQVRAFRIVAEEVEELTIA